MNLIETIRAVLDRHQLIPDGTNVVLGVSGGMDSVALLHAFHQLGIPFTVAHLNHGLRGADADADETFVRNLGFPVVVKSVDVRQLAAESGLSIEMAARQARHDFFSEFEHAVIALAHHADDQVETFILKLARGAGTEGLGGMAYAQRIGTLRLIRPMLDLPRSEIREWLTGQHLSWREDASNTDTTYLRNRVRHTVIPLLEAELNPGIRETILRTMNILRAENEWMDATISDCRSPIAELSVAAQRRTLRKWLFDQGAVAADFDAVDKILSLMESGQGTSVYELSDSQRVVIEYGLPRFESSVADPVSPEWILKLETGTGWRKDHGRGAGHLPAEASFSADQIGDSPILVRGCEPGDRIAPFGMDGSRKLQDILTDQKIPRARRKSVPVVTCRDEIIWVPGYRIARGWAVESDKAKAVHVCIEHISHK